MLMDFFGPAISGYTKEDAIEDGTQALLGNVDGRGIYITSTLLFEGFEDDMSRRQLIDRGLSALSRPDPQDTEYMRLRVLEKGRIWVIEALDGITFMRPQDY